MGRKSRPHHFYPVGMPKMIQNRAQRDEAVGGGGRLNLFHERQKMIQKVPKKSHFYSFLSAGKHTVVFVSATQSATNSFSPAKISAKSQKAAKNYPIAGISSARSPRFPAAAGSIPISCPSSSSCPSCPSCLKSRLCETKPWAEVGGLTLLFLSRQSKKFKTHSEGKPLFHF